VKGAAAMQRYAAFLRGVSPMNAKLSELKKCFEAAGFRDVITILSSGNVVFSADTASEAVLERRAESAMTEGLGRAFLTIIRPVDVLQEILDADPYKAFRIPPDAKRVISFLRKVPKSKLSLPIEVDGACILCLKGAMLSPSTLQTLADRCS
jgi:uncharacterized protein (DUF1697 family)